VIVVLCKPCHVAEHVRTGTWGAPEPPPCPCRICDTGSFD
jgi:hypothetical protein